MTVELDPALVEARLAARTLTCPACTAALAGWGWARPRMIRDGDRRVRLVPRRARCCGCALTHVLLPVVALARRADTAAVIGWALTARAAGRGHHWIAERLGLPADTVRGWLRRFGARLAPVEALSRPGFDGGCEPRRGWQSWEHHGSTPRSCANARSA